MTQHVKIRTATISHTDILNAHDGTNYLPPNVNLQLQLNLFTDFVVSFGKR